MSQSHAHSPDLSARNISLTGGAATFQLAMTVLFVIGIGGAAALFLTGNATPQFFWKAYLQNFIFLVAISLGGLFFVFIQHLTRAGWSVAVRRPAEILASNLRWLPLLFVVPFGILWMRGEGNLVWPWADMATLTANHPDEAYLVKKKISYFSLSASGDFFWARAIVYFLVWAGLAHFFYSNSLKLGATGDQRIASKMGYWAGPAAILFGLTSTFAAFDWMMSLSPAWFSTMFGVYFFAGCCTVGFAALIITCVLVQSTGALKGVISLEHYQDLGKLLFAFGMVFWAYIGYSQYMLIWYANIPEETGWFLARQIGGWTAFSLFLLAGHFVLPFLAFISKWPKRMPAVLACGAGWMLLLGWLDLYWLVHPVVPHDIATFQSYDALQAKYASESTQLANPVSWLLLVGMVGLYGLMTVRELRKAPLLCVKDPRLDESLRFENM
jgi:hypothetical protein